MGATTWNNEHYSSPLSSLTVDQPYLLSILSSRAVDDGQTAGYEVVLDVHDDDGRPGSDDLLDPAIPAVDKLLLAHTAVTGHVEDHEEITDQLGVHPGSDQDLYPGINYIVKFLTCKAFLSHF